MLDTWFHQVLNDKGYDGTASDIWSCGVILFVLMAGYLPFDEPNLMALYKKVRFLFIYLFILYITEVSSLPQ